MFTGDCGLEPDNGDYEPLKLAVQSIKEVPGLICEIGTCRGNSARVIIDSLIWNGDLGRDFISLDPFGNILYVAFTGCEERRWYTNAMRDVTRRNLYAYVCGKPVNLHLLAIEDTEYFARYADGFPTYNQVKTLQNEYALVFFDGPHDVGPVMHELAFFHPRTRPGSFFVFDDLDFYDHDGAVHPLLLTLGWELVARTGMRKAAYRRN